MEELLEKKEELNTIASRNSGIPESKSKEILRPGGRKRLTSLWGDQVLLKREQRKSGLDAQVCWPVPSDRKAGPHTGASKE